MTLQTDSTAARPKLNRRGGAPRGNKNAKKHGLSGAKKALSEFGQRAIDGRSALGRAMADFRAELERDLGGDLSAQQATIVELICRTRLLVDGCDAFIFTTGAISKRKRSLYPIVQQRQQLADSLARYLGQLGLERRPRPQPSLGEYLARRESEAGQAKVNGGSGDAAKPAEIADSRPDGLQSGLHLDESTGEAKAETQVNQADSEQRDDDTQRFAKPLPEAEA